MDVIVLANQSLFDIAIQYTGTDTTVFDIAVANELNITDALHAGQTLTIPDAIIRANVPISNYYARNGLTPATGTRNDLELDRIFAIELPLEFS